MPYGKPPYGNKFGKRGPGDGFSSRKRRPGRMYPGPKSDKFYRPMPGHPNAGPKDRVKRVYPGGSRGEALQAVRKDLTARHPVGGGTTPQKVRGDRYTTDKMYRPEYGPKGQPVDKQSSAAPASTIGSRREAAFAAAREKVSNIKAEVRKKSAESLKREQDQPQNLNRPALNKGPAPPNQNRLPAGIVDKVQSLNKKRKTY